MRGLGSSAYVVTVKPAGTVGITPSGFGTVRLIFGLPVPGAGSASARGCGTAELCCATTSAPANAIATSDARTTRFIATPSGKAMLQLPTPNANANREGRLFPERPSPLASEESVRLISLMPVLVGRVVLQVERGIVSAIGDRRIHADCVCEGSRT